MTRPSLASIEQRADRYLLIDPSTGEVWPINAPAADVLTLVAALRDVLAVADQLDRLAARHPDSETGRVETAAAHEIRTAITVHIDTTTPKETDRD